MIWAIPKAIHLLGAVIWVGGMFFALLVLRPSLAVLEPPQRLALHGQVFRRFFLIVWHAMPLVLLSGYFMLFTVYGGFAGASPYIHVMHLTGLIMAAAANAIRKLILVNLILGILTIIVASFIA